MKKYFYSNGEEKNGPFSFDELKNEEINKETLIWYSGLEDWMPAEEIKEFEEILELIPPPIPISEPPPLPTDEFKTNMENSESEDPVEVSLASKNSSANYQGMFSNPFSFDGRIRRFEYGISIFISYALIIIVNILIETSEDTAVILFVVYIPFFWFLLAQGAKRCHDLGNNGWYQLIPFYGLWMLFAGGEKWVNKYGSNPKN